jgi:hypothetical protein
MLTLFDQSAKAESSKRIKQWLRDALELPEHVMLLVTEMVCNDPDCAPLETVITVWYVENAPRQAKIFKPLAHVTYDDIGAVMYQLTVNS